MRASWTILALAVGGALLLGWARPVRADCPADQQWTTAADFTDEFWVNVNTNGADELVVNSPNLLVPQSHIKAF